MVATELYSVSEHLQSDSKQGNEKNGGMFSNIVTLLLTFSSSWESTKVPAQSKENVGLRACSTL
jgi:hypothetical protein